jgi:hypothetical protein
VLAVPAIFVASVLTPSQIHERERPHPLGPPRPYPLDRCEPCRRRGRYNAAKLMEKYGDAKLPDLLPELAQCPKAHSASIHDQCKAVYGKDSRWSTSASLKPS